MPSVPRNRYLLFGLIAVVGCATDLVTKAWFNSWPELVAGNVYWLWRGHVGIQLSWNQGALFGMGQGNSWLFAAMATAAGCAVPAWLFWFGAARDAWLTAALGGIMAGILGNLYDRLGLPATVWPRGDVDIVHIHAVRDWMLWQWSDELRWPNFNIADSLLVVGAAALVWHAFWNPDHNDKPAHSVGNRDSGRPDH